MATKRLAHSLLFEMGRGNINFQTGAFRIILMQAGYTFNRFTHAKYSNVSGSELATGNGYTATGNVLTPSTGWVQQDDQNRATVSWANSSWTADGGDIGPTKAAIILQWNNGSPADSLVVGAFEFDDAVTVSNGISFQLQDLGFDLKQAD